MELVKVPTPVPFVVFVASAIVGAVVVPQTIPLEVTAAPPSELMTPPLLAELVVIALIAVVEVIVGIANCAVAPIIFTKLVPLYNCISPFVPQSEQNKIRPATGLAIAVF